VCSLFYDLFNVPVTISGHTSKVTNGRMSTAEQIGKGTVVHLFEVGHCPGGAEENNDKMSLKLFGPRADV
jgi:hypothetical protein